MPVLKITVKFFATLRKTVKDKEIMLEVEEGTTILHLLEIIVNIYPSLHDQIFNVKTELREWIKILINGRNIIFLNGLKTELNYGDEVALFPPVAGGR
ncbi:MAG: ubiquitin-like small modifier protein 1 [Candidatus Hodarchaeota archaeon]